MTATMPRSSPAHAWRRALERTAPIPHRRDRILPLVVDELAERRGGAPALLSDEECFTYRALAQRSAQWARWAIAQGIARGEAVALLMPNRPEYLAIWLGITRAGGCVALLNTNLDGASLAHAIDAAAPRHVIVDGRLAARVMAIQRDLRGAPAIWTHGDARVDRYSPCTLQRDECPAVTIDDRALYVYTSGTEGPPKAAVVSHARVMQWTHWFAGLMDVDPGDRLYDCLPMYHSVGGVLAPGAMLAGGGSVVIRERFSASCFWSDIARWDCTLFQYIGELCRYLLHSAPHPEERTHRLRLCCGNGLRADVWEKFRDRFGIPQILEFYASTEGNVSLVNADGKPGAVGRIPPFLAHRFPAALVQYDETTGALRRDASRRCIRCAPDETGELIGPIHAGATTVSGRFEGYTDAEASARKIVRDVFAPGDAWFRTGDLMRRDERGYFYFVDRVGDTFRWKGENVATCEVSDAICAFTGIRDAEVFGVAVPGADGRVGMAAIVADAGVDFGALRTHLAERLPGYAMPMFLRVRRDLAVTGTFKHIKRDLVRDGYDPLAIDDAVYFNDRRRGAFVRLDRSIFDAIQRGDIRL